jgi:carboxyl-terminal processing protease
MHDPSSADTQRQMRDWAHLLAGLALGLAVGLVAWKVRPSGDPELERYREVRDYVRSQYVSEKDERELLEQSLHGMVEALDPYSRFYGADEVAQLKRETSGQYTGIGVVFATPLSEARVLFTLPKSPARRAGIRVGDKLLRVGGREVGAMAPGELRALLGQAGRGPIEVALLGRDEVERSTLVGADELVDPSVRHARIVDEALGVGYLAILSFSQETADEFDAAVRELSARGMKALVVDLRGNLGGVLRAAVRIANRFVPEGVIVSHESRNETLRYSAESALATHAGMPLVVLVDGESASASEVLAAALQEHRAAVVVGSPTYGKGMVQQVRTFGDGEMVVKLITSYYYTPSHRNLERTVEGAWSVGVLPDVELALKSAENDALRAWRASYSPPEELREQIAEWERAEGRKLTPQPPPDAHLDAALELFRGRRPGAYSVAARP